MSDRPPPRQPSVDPQAAAHRESLRRLLWVKIGVLVVFAVVALRLVQIQVLQSHNYREIARKQYEVKVPQPAARGNIYDRNGKLLVSNTQYISFGADPRTVGERAEAVAERFARVFGKPRGFYLDKLSAQDKRFVWLERRAKPQLSKAINAPDLQGVIELKEPQRLYHYEHIGGQVIGFTDVDNTGLNGIELALDRYLKGKDGYVVMQRDGLGRKRPSVDYPRVEPTNGASVVLTIDIEYQAIAEEELARGIQRNHAESGLVVILDPATGEVLAMANSPAMDPANLAGTSQAVMKNRAITDTFEPGSVFKIVTASAALEKGVAKPDQKFYAERGRYIVKLPGGKLRPPITDTHEYGTITFQEAMELSSNIVMAKISDRIGAEGLYTMARNYGFGIETGIDLPGEVNGDLKRPNLWSATTLNSMAFGYEVGVTPMQIASAYASVANKGVMEKPIIVRKIIDQNQEPVVEAKPQTIRRVIEKPTAEILTRFLEGVVERGTGVQAKIAGLKVAGKTGTSRKVIEGRYEQGRYTASFVGYFPADEPKVVCLVMLDNPREGGYTGGLVSAPIFKAIAQKIYAMSGRFTRTPGPVMAGNESLVVPDLVSLNSDVAGEMLAARGLKSEIEGNGSLVRGQSPRAGAVVSRGGTVKLQTKESDAAPPGYAVVPDLRGMPMRRAINSLAIRQLEVGITGSGVVTSQTPQAGQQVKVGTRVAVRCEPRNRSLLSMN
jgi:cell division protein FtsI (penicillin-binding protein 3)